ncbi:MAG: response regulator transcription factor [Clostridiales bacterium]|jgi:DNA-binding response OmpR family regulator|nr:response regulator transcription factor [Clostridiales bacterium]
MDDRVLIIEDDESIAELERDALSAAGYETDVAATGEAGIALALEREYACVVLDIMLPGADGFEVCRRLRDRQDTPVLFVTARMSDADKIKAFAGGADDYIVKPFSLAELTARVAARISRYDALTGGARRGRFSIGSLTFDLPRRKVSRDGRDVPLANKEFELLTFLARNPGEVFSKEQILNAVWGGDAFIEPGTVSVHVNRLREKIENNPQAPERLKTVWGVGYKLE